jgi:hypothetical protein
MKIKLSIVVTSLFGAFSFAAQAASVPQTFNFPFTFSDVITNSSTEFVSLPNSGDNEAAVLPFDTTLGTLDSVDVNWTWGVSFSGLSGANSGNVGLYMPGTVSLLGFGYGGNGAGGGNGVAPNTSFSAATSSASVNKNFSAADAGFSYNSAIWAAFSGNSSYTAKLALGGYSLSYANLASGTFTSNADLVVTYNYTAAAVPEPSAFALLGVGALYLGARRRRTA